MMSEVCLEGASSSLDRSHSVTNKWDVTNASQPNHIYAAILRRANFHPSFSPALPFPC